MENELEVFRQLAEKQQGQIDRLLSLLEEAQSCARGWRDIALLQNKNGGVNMEEPRTEVTITKMEEYENEIND